MKPSVRMFICAVAALVFLIGSCASSAHIVISDNSDYVLNAAFLPNRLLEKNVAHLLNQNNAQSIFNREELERSLTEAGLKVKNLTLQGVMGLTVSCTLPRTHPLMNRCLQYDRRRQELALTLSPETVQSFLAMIPEESRGFIDMLMAPLFEGGTVTAAEYEELIAAAYGKKVAAELKSSEFVLTVDVPYPVKTASVSPIGSVTVQRGKASGAVIRFPLIDLLCTVETIEVRL